MLEVLGEDYVRTARAKGLRERRILWRHALRNALMPSVTVLGLELGLLAGGVFLVETIFAWPGLGRYAYDAIRATDYNATLGVTLVVAMVYVVVNLLVDLVYLYLDPRIKYA
jgi:peptide/nickel transport system permease protein